MRRMKKRVKDCRHRPRVYASLQTDWDARRREACTCGGVERMTARRGLNNSPWTRMKGRGVGAAWYCVRRRDDRGVSLGNRPWLVIA